MQYVQQGPFTHEGARLLRVGRGLHQPQLALVLHVRVGGLHQFLVLNGVLLESTNPTYLELVEEEV